MNNKTKRKKADSAHFNKAFGLPAIKKDTDMRTTEGKIRSAMDADPTNTALSARSRHYGGGTSADDREAMRPPHMGHDLGRVLNHTKEGKDQIARLWTVWCGLTSARRTYRMRVLGTTGSPKGATMEMVSGNSGDDERQPADIRSEDEKDADARRQWIYWLVKLSAISCDMVSRLFMAENGTNKPFWINGHPTIEGMLTADALSHLADVVDPLTASKN